MRQILRNVDPLSVFITVIIGGSLSLIVALRQARIPANTVAHPAHLVTPAPPPAASPPPLRPVAVERKPDVAAAQSELRDATSSLESTEARMRALAAQLDDMKNRIRDLEDELRRYDATAAVSAGDPSVDALNARRQKLEDALADAKNEFAALQSRIEEVRDTSAKVMSVPGSQAVTAGKLPVLVDLIHNRAFPFEKGFYRMPVLAGIERTYGATRVGAGLTIAEIHQSDGAFAEFLSKLRPERRYVSCLLNSDSFEAYYAVREETRKRGLDIGWEPANTADGRLNVYTVKLVGRYKAAKARNKRDIPDIVRDAK